MFALLLAIPFMPIDQRPWMLIGLLGLFVLLLHQILRNAIELWRSGAWSAAAEQREPEVEQRWRAGPVRAPAINWTPPVLDKAIVVPPTGRPLRVETPSTRPRKDALVWADEPTPAPRPPRPVPKPRAPNVPATVGGTGLTIEVRAFEDGVVDLGIHAADGSTSASTRISEPVEGALRFGDALRGFTADPSDRRDVQLGSFDAGDPGGGVRLVLFNREGIGRAYVTVWPDAAADGAGLRQTASIAFALDAADLREFAAALSAAVLTPGSRVELPIAPAD